MQQEQLNTILILGTILTGIIYTITRIFSGAGKATKESNELLRDLIDDQKQEMLKLRGRMHETENHITELKLKVQILTDRRNYLEKLITTALREHFTADPAIAKATQDLVSKEE